TLTRDYLLDSNPANAQQYVDQFQSIREKTAQSFSILESLAQDDQQRTALQHLRQELDEYWDPTEVVLDWSPEQKRTQRSLMLRQRVRRRQEVFDLAEQVERLITANYLRERQRITTAESDFRSSLGWITGIAMLLAAGIAVTTLMRMLTLERQSEAAEGELRELSVQLRTAQEQERKYLSRELHDQVGQMLTGLRMELTGMNRLLAGSENELASRITRAKGTVEQTLRIVRNIAMLLRPSMLDDLGLTPAIAWLVKEVSRTSGIDITSEVDHSVDSLPDAQRTCIFRVVQEALTNVTRHSGARNVDIRLRASGSWVTGIIMDDGHGFSTTSNKRKGIGLLGMEERVRELNGTVRITTAPGRGTSVEFRLPRPLEPEEPIDTNSDSGRSRDRSDRIKASA
ncbi:MAG: sensor histidine kinase, partial [Bryobacterales bacterium]|nr:sensor histidine kinase [Bryobacterales bacterium]